MSTMTLNLDLPLTDADRAVLSALATAGLGDLPPAPAAKPAKAPAKAPAKSKSPAKESKPAPEAPEESKAPAPEAPAEDKAPAPEAPAEPKEGPTVEQAVARAAALLSEGKADSVKAALATLDISRVSQLKPSQVETFLKELGS